MKHDFETKYTQEGLRKISYKQCRACNAVLLENDPLFNMNCVVASREVQELKKKLEMSNHS